MKSGSVTRMRGGWWLPVCASLAVNLLLLFFLPVAGTVSPVSRYEPGKIHRVRVVKVPERSIFPAKKRPGPPKKELLGRVETSFLPRLPDRFPLPENPIELQASSIRFALPQIPIDTSIPGISGMPSLFDAADLDSPLVPEYRVPPVYPLAAKMKGIEGWVKVRFTVDPSGEVRDPEIVASEPAGVFEDSVIRCVSRWRFAPGRVMGEPVSVRAETTIRFRLEDVR